MNMSWISSAPIVIRKFCISISYHLLFCKFFTTFWRALKAATTACTATLFCSNKCKRSCCFQCSPKRSKRLTKEQMVGYMEQVKRDFPTVISLVLTGGECTLLPELAEIINVATNHGYFVSQMKSLKINQHRVVNSFFVAFAFQNSQLNDEDSWHWFR